MTDTSKLADDDHARGCEGRCYTCTCGYDDRVDAALRERDTLAAENARLREALESIYSFSTGWGPTDPATTMGIVARDALAKWEAFDV